MSEKLRQIMKINVGPQHPSTHGVLRLMLDVDGETIKSAEPVIGYLHRGMEKMAESRSYLQYMPIVDRIDYLSGFFCSEAFCSCVENLLDIEVPIRAQYLRVMMMELNRITSHLLWLGTFMLDLGATSPYFYCFREREAVVALFEELTGARMMYNYHVFGGVKRDLPKGFLDKLKIFCDDFPSKIQEYEDIITNNPIFLKRTSEVGVLTKKVALDYSITGPNLRASGIDLDFRKKKPYLCYSNLEFETPVREAGDSWSRYHIRINEMRESLKIVQQCAKWLSEDSSVEINLLDIKTIAVKPKAGMALSYIEAPRGLMNCIVYSDGGIKPVRVKWRTSSFYAAQVLPVLIKNHLYSDLMAIFGSLDIIMPEVDR